jgi:hypothetical protein
MTTYKPLAMRCALKLHFLKSKLWAAKAMRVFSFTEVP